MIQASLHSCVCFPSVFPLLLKHLLKLCPSLLRWQGRKPKSRQPLSDGGARARLHPLLVPCHHLHLPHVVASLEGGDGWGGVGGLVWYKRRRDSTTAIELNPMDGPLRNMSKIMLPLSHPSTHPHDAEPFPLAPLAAAPTVAGRKGHRLRRLPQQLFGVLRQQRAQLLLN